MPKPSRSSRAKAQPAAAAAAAPQYRTRVLNDIPSTLPNLKISVIVDVGAHVGDTTREFAAAYPDARVIAFEPVPETYKVLIEAVSEAENVACVPLALGEVAGQATMRVDGTSVGNRIVPGTTADADHVTVDVVTGDTWCAENGVSRIGLLKIDSEGHDLKVLAGFQKMLADAAIDIIQVEANMRRVRAREHLLQDFIGYLGPMGYHLFGLYGMQRKYRGMPVLARVDPVFIAAPVMERNTRE